MMEKLKWVSDQQQRLATRSSDRHHGTTQSFEKDRMYGFSWPQRNYRCSFCKKEFKSAQALGGHMNVHRRDRARMRQLSPPPPPDHFHNYPSSSTLVNPNPSTFSQLSASSTLPHHHHEFLLPYYNNLSSSFGNTSATNDSSSVKTDFRGGDGETKKKNKGTMLELTATTAAGFAARKKDARVWKANHEFVRLDLSLGLFKDSKEDLDLDLDLDLELRLGCS